MIADRRNHCLIEVAPDKRIIWQFDSPDLEREYRGWSIAVHSFEAEKGNTQRF